MNAVNSIIYTHTYIYLYLCQYSILFFLFSVYVVVVWYKFVKLLLEKMCLKLKC